jgi:hypothetical protein
MGSKLMQHTEGVVEHTRHSLSRVAYLWYNVHVNAIQTKIKGEDGGVTKIPLLLTFALLVHVSGNAKFPN